MTELSQLVRYQLLPDVSPVTHGQGTVWKARDLLFDEIVAIKELKKFDESFPAKSGNSILFSTVLIDKFWKEAAVGARLGRICPNIVKVFDYGQIEGVPYFVMEWIEGGNIDRYRGQVSLLKAKGILRQICSAVRTAHQHNIVHSDIAPANILYDKAMDSYKLADFGYIKILDSILISRGLVNLLPGGRSYFLPPEHLLNPERINKSTDIYALALTFHMLLTRKQLEVDGTGRLKIPGVILIRHENKGAPDEVRKLLQRFVTNHLENDSVDEFVDYLNRIP